MGFFPGVQQKCDVCRDDLWADPDVAHGVFEIDIRQIGPVPADTAYSFVVCRACKWWAVGPLLKAWAHNRTPEEVDVIRHELADFALNAGNDR